MFQLADWVKLKDKSKNKYFGEVISRNDPLGDNAVQIRIKSLHQNVPDEYLPWYRPAKNLNTTNNYEVNLPPIGAILEIQFEDEDFYNGVYLRGIKKSSDLNDSFFDDYGTFSKGFKTSTGNTIKVYDSGNILVETASGYYFTLTGDTLNTNANITTTANIIAKQITVEEAIVNNIPISTHKHISAPSGSPTSTPTA